MQLTVNSIMLTLDIIRVVFSMCTCLHMKTIVIRCIKVYTFHSVELEVYPAPSHHPTTPCMTDNLDNSGIPYARAKTMLLISTVDAYWTSCKSTGLIAV